MKIYKLPFLTKSLIFIMDFLFAILKKRSYIVIIVAKNYNKKVIKLTFFYVWKQGKEHVIKAAQDDSVKSILDLTVTDQTPLTSTPLEKALDTQPLAVSRQLLPSPQKITVHFTPPPLSGPLWNFQNPNLPPETLQERCHVLRM